MWQDIPSMIVYFTNEVSMKRLCCFIVSVLCVQLSGCSKVQTSSNPYFNELQGRVLFNPVQAKLLSQDGNAEDAIKFLPNFNNYHLQNFDGTRKTEQTTSLEQIKFDSTAESLKHNLNTLDGFAMSASFPLYLDLPSNILPDSDSDQPVRLFKVNLYNQFLHQDKACFGLPSEHGDFCGTEMKELAYIAYDPDNIKAYRRDNHNDVGAFTLIYHDDQLLINPVVPFEPNASYLVVVTSQLHSKQDIPFRGSPQYINMREGIFKPTSKLYPFQQQIQAQIAKFTRYSALHDGKKAVSSNEVIYTAAFTIESASEPFHAVLDQMVANDVKPALVPELKQTTNNGTNTYQLHTPRFIDVASITENKFNDFDQEEGVLKLESFDRSYWHAATPSYAALISYANSLTNTNEQQKFANRVKTETNVDFKGYWSAVANGHRKQVRDFVQALAENVHKINMKTSQLKKYDPLRSITRYNPMPDIRTDKDTQPLEVMVNIPTNKVRPNNGWPTVILMHGLNSRKEDMQAVADSLKKQGIASVAIDLPRHGSRNPFTNLPLDNDPKIDQALKNTISAGLFMHMRNMAVIRDQLRQASIDNLALRLALNTYKENDQVIFDSNNISLISLSLGAITGTQVTTYAHRNPQFALKKSLLFAPGAGLSNMLMYSPQLKDRFDAFVEKSVSAQYTGNKREQMKVQLKQKFTQNAASILDQGEPIGHLYALQSAMQQDNKTKVTIFEMVDDTVISNYLMAEKSACEINPTQCKPTSGTDPFWLTLDPDLVDLRKMHANEYDFEVPNPKKTQACTWHAFLTGSNAEHEHEQFRENIIQNFLIDKN
jgi:hypothetical protein